MASAGLMTTSTGCPVRRSFGDYIDNDRKKFSIEWENDWSERLDEQFRPVAPEPPKGGPS